MNYTVKLILIGAVFGLSLGHLASNFITSIEYTTILTVCVIAGIVSPFVGES